MFSFYFASGRKFFLFFLYVMYENPFYSLDIFCSMSIDRFEVQAFIFLSSFSPISRPKENGSTQLASLPPSFKIGAKHLPQSANMQTPKILTLSPHLYLREGIHKG